MAYGKPSRGGESPVIRGTSISPTTKPLLPQSSNDMMVTGLTPSSLNLNAPQANSERIVLNREVFNKEAFNNTVNTNFSQLDQLAPDLSFFDPNLATVEDLFNIYQNLFFQIPKFGDINSHEYLVVESTEYTGFIENQEQIDALLEEIVDLREENLQLQLDITQLLGAKETLDQVIRQNPEVDGSSLEDLIAAETEAGAAQSNSSSDLLVTDPISGAGTLPPSSPGGSGGGGGGGTPGSTNGFTDVFAQNENYAGSGAPLPGFGFGNPANINNNVY